MRRIIMMAATLLAALSMQAQDDLVRLPRCLRKGRARPSFYQIFIKLLAHLIYYA